MLFWSSGETLFALVKVFEDSVYQVFGLLENAAVKIFQFFCLQVESFQRLDSIDHVVIKLTVFLLDTWLVFNDFVRLTDQISKVVMIILRPTFQFLQALKISLQIVSFRPKIGLQLVTKVRFFKLDDVQNFLHCNNKMNLAKYLYKIKDYRQYVFF